MSKDPAFLFYPGDWLGGTLGMTFEEKGAYMDLLMLQFNRGHMTSHMIGQVVGQLWVNLEVKFVQDEKGLWYNERLDSEIKKRKGYINSRVNNISGKNQYTKKIGHMGGHMTSHMENENVNVNINKEKGVKGEKQIDSTIVIYDPKILYEEFKNSFTWLQNILTSNYAAGLKGQITELEKYIVQFIQEQRDKDELNKTFKEYKRYFINWLQYKIKDNSTSKPKTTLNAAEAAAKINALPY